MSKTNYIITYNNNILAKTFSKEEAILFRNAYIFNKLYLSNDKSLAYWDSHYGLSIENYILLCAALFFNIESVIEDIFRDADIRRVKIEKEFYKKLDIEVYEYKVKELAALVRKSKLNSFK